MNRLPSSAACERNKGPILEVLRQEIANRRTILEIGSGTGQHAVYFAGAMPQLMWQTSDLPENHDTIRRWLHVSDLPNVGKPLALDVQGVDSSALSDYEFDAVFSANTAHIMPMQAVAHMFDLVGRLLPADGIFCLYGPFNFAGRFSSDSNAEFDASLKRHDPTMGIRELESLDAFGERAGLTRARLYAMPASNHIAVWVKGTAVGQDA